MTPSRSNRMAWIDCVTVAAPSLCTQAGGAYDQPWFENHFVGLRALAVDQLEEHGHERLRHFQDGLAHRGERRREMLDAGGVVKTRDTELGADGQTGVDGRAHSADSQVV